MGNALELHIEAEMGGQFANACLTKGETKGKIPGTDYPFMYVKNTQYVHQLQNLYYALTGEELTINK